MASYTKEVGEKQSKKSRLSTMQSFFVNKPRKEEKVQGSVANLRKSMMPTGGEMHQRITSVAHKLNSIRYSQVDPFNKSVRASMNLTKVMASAKPSPRDGVGSKLFTKHNRSSTMFEPDLFEAATKGYKQLLPKPEDVEKETRDGSAFSKNIIQDNNNSEISHDHFPTKSPVKPHKLKPLNKTTSKKKKRKLFHLSRDVSAHRSPPAIVLINAHINVNTPAPINKSELNSYNAFSDTDI